MFNLSIHENHNIVEELSIVRIYYVYIYICIRVDNICRTLLFLGGGQSLMHSLTSEGLVRS